MFTSSKISVALIVVELYLEESKIRSHMEESNKEVQETADPENEESLASKAITDFNFLISTLIQYYQAKSGLRGDDEGDEWKQGTKYERMDVPKMEMPKRVDDAVERAFLAQLKKFHDPVKVNAQ